MEYFEPRNHHLFNIYQFRQLTQEKEESYDDFATRLKLAACPCKTAGKVCFSCGGTFPHAGGRMKCPARRKKCLTCNKMNHFAKCCRMKGKENKGVLKAVEKESLCGIEKVEAVKHNQDRRPVSSVTVENREFQVLVDTGATVNVMDEITFKRLLADKVTLRRSSSVLRAYQSNENPSAPLKVMGKFEATVESNTRIAPATFHVVKGHTNTEPLIGFQTTEDLGLVKVANTVQSEETMTSNLLKEYADLFRGIGKMKGVKVDLHADPTRGTIIWN